MKWREYEAILRRRWWIVLSVLALAVLASGYSYAKSRKSAGYLGCTTLYVADVSSPSLISAPQTTLETAGQLLAGETAANFFADDILDVAQGTRVATFLSNKLARSNFPSAAFADINGAVSGTRRDRTVQLCAANPQSITAIAAAGGLADVMVHHRAAYMGADMAKRTRVTVISMPTVAPASTSHAAINFLLRVFLGFLVSLGVALLWDSMDPRVRNREDVERVLGVPVLGEIT